jgi:hypothetical protein
MHRKIVCSTTHLFHYLMDPIQEDLASLLQYGIRPLSDFPESTRWKQIQEHMPGFYEDLYKLMAQPIIREPYPNSGIFVTPIDFRLVEGAILSSKPRVKIPLHRVDPHWAVTTYAIDDDRVTLPFAIEVLENIAELWTEEMVRRWFAVDPTKMFFYVPQVAIYQGRVIVDQDDFEASL